MPSVSNDLSQKLYATMEKHKEVCDCYSVLDVTVTFIIRAAVAASLQL